MLSEKHKIFCDEYLIDFNATRSYKVAYGENLSDEVASTNGSRLLRNAKVSEYLGKRIREREKRTEITQDDVVRSLKMILDANVTDVVNAKGQYKITVKDTSVIPKELQFAIKSIKPSKAGIEVEFYDKLKAAELLGKHVGMFDNKLSIESSQEEKVADVLEGIISAVDKKTD